MNLLEHCINLFKRNDLESFKGVASLDEQRQVERAVTVLRVAHFVRMQFRMLSEFLPESIDEESSLLEKAGLVGREKDFVDMYVRIVRQHHFPVTPVLATVSKVHATTHRDMGVCLLQLQHPTLQKFRQAQAIIRQPKGNLITREEALEHFFSMTGKRY